MKHALSKSKVTATLVAGLIDFASFRGINPTSLRTLIQDKNIDIYQPDGQVDSIDYLAILKTVLRQVQDPYLGLAFGFYLNLAALGIVHSISLRTQSIEQALLLLENYLDSNFPLLNLDFHKKNKEIQVILTSSVEDTELRKSILDTSFCLIFRELILMTNSSAIKLSLPFKTIAAFEERFRLPIEVGTHYTISINLVEADDNINPKNLRSIELLLPQYMLMLEKNKENKNFTTLTINMILHLCTPQLPTLQDICKQFAMSSRSFQRKLAEEGTSFRAISNNIKKEISAYLQAGNRMKTQDIAYILGYSESSAYLKAQKSWNNIH